MRSAKARSWAVVFCLCASLYAQQSAPTQPSAAVPQLVNYSGKAADSQGNAVTGIVGVTFSIYKEQSGGVPLWMETQNVMADSKGNYTVQLGAGTSSGLPLNLFSTGEARWLGVRINGGEEQARVMLLSVPYALKAGDAATVGGLPPSAFVLAAPNASNASGNLPLPSAAPATIGGSGTLDFLPLWTPNGNTLGNSVLFQSGTGSSAKIGINTTTPSSMLDIQGGETVRGTLTLPAAGSATATAGKNSQPEKVTASSYNSSSQAAVGQSFQWQAEPTGNNSSKPSGTLNLLFGSGNNTPSETGLNIGSTGLITFAKGQSFPGAGTITGITTGSSSGLTGGVTSGTANLTLLTNCAANQVLEWNGQAWACTTISGSGSGTVTSVGLSAPSTDFTVSGSPITKSGTLALNWTIPPTSVDIANAIVKRDSNGSISVEGLTAESSITTQSWMTAANSGANISAITGTDTSDAATYAGVYGASTNGYGVYGAGETGVYGNGGSGVVGWSLDGIGVVGSTQNGTGIYGVGLTGVYGYGTSGNAVTAYNAAGGYGIYSYSSGYTAYFNGPNGDCHVDGAGNLACTGSKLVVVPVDEGSRRVALYAVEASENWFEDFGSGRLSNGRAVINLDPTFAQTVNTDVDYHVFLTPNGDSRGLYVSAKTGTSFEVHEQGGGTSHVRFDYRIVARRKGYENIRLAETPKASSEKNTKPEAPPAMPPRPKTWEQPRTMIPPVGDLRIGQRQ